MRFVKLELDNATAKGEQDAFDLPRTMLCIENTFAFVLLFEVSHKEL